jgi:pseudaminic acid biosynthesis-associated methylase
MNNQEKFWKEEYAKAYQEKNRTFNREQGINGWKIMLKEAENVESLLECGSNIGRNIDFLSEILPLAKKSIIEINPEAYSFVVNTYKIEDSYNGSICDSNLPKEKYDLTFTSGVLIHIHPSDLLKNMTKLYEYSKRYILIAEYFNRTPVMIEYQGEKDRLFKSDFGKTFISNFPVKLVDYGFLWGHLYDDGGWDDFTYWLFEKNI